MDNHGEFVGAMRGVDPDILDLADALFAAMDLVGCHGDESGEVRYFGAIGDGAFYAGGEIETARWFPDTTEVEAVAMLAAEFGWEACDDLPHFMHDESGA